MEHQETFRNHFPPNNAMSKTPSNNKNQMLFSIF